jgi:hypothetical protein
VVADRFVPADPLAVRSSTIDAPVGFVDVWHRGRWPRLTEGRAGLAAATTNV